ncbi:MAG TPA: 4-hydroxy-3-methylbut-2-enyl diphosphate reductase [Thermomicrobiales bacterium]|nr:4-hydroxy-3-methylbut-2-enyl diphosphate reductase [Thermomicrobiales bacterium]
MATASASSLTLRPKAPALRETEPARERKIIVAEELGYCWGVRRALDIIQDAASPEHGIAPIGDIIHNPQVVGRLRRNGVIGAMSVDEAQMQGFSRVAITAHGYGPQLAEEADEKGMELVDTTCPLVVKVQRLAQKLVRQGYYLVVYGDSYHPEVKGVLAWANTTKSCAAKHIEDLPWNAARGETGEGKIVPPRKVAVVSQTTKNIAELMEFSNELQRMVMPEGGEYRLCNTICEPTTKRQNALKTLADQVHLILAIGGKKSSNTARLAEVGNQQGVQSYHIESASDIQDEWLEALGDGNVGLTAGASTPDDVIEEIVTWLADRGYIPPAGGIRPVDPDYVPAF